MSTQNNRKSVFIFSLLVVIFILGYKSWSLHRSFLTILPSPAPTGTPRSATTIIDMDTKTITAYTRNISASESAFSLLQAVASRQNLHITTKKYSFGILIEAIGNLSNSKNKAWIYFVNGQAASVGADSYQVRSGDTIEWKYIPQTAN